MLQINFTIKVMKNQDFQNAIPFPKTDASYDLVAIAPLLRG